MSTLAANQLHLRVKPRVFSIILCALADSDSAGKPESLGCGEAPWRSAFLHADDGVTYRTHHGFHCPEA